MFVIHMRNITIFAPEIIYFSFFFNNLRRFCLYSLALRFLSALSFFHFSTSATEPLAHGLRLTGGIRIRVIGI